MDEDGNINNDHAIHLRAQRAAERIARQRGWTTAMHIHEANIPKVSADCMEALRELGRWSWEGYADRLAAKGYGLYLRDNEGVWLSNHWMNILLVVHAICGVAAILWVYAGGYS